MIQRKNINRGYQKLIVWQDAADLYVSTCKIFRKFHYELRRVASNQIASVDSVHRNIAEGYRLRIFSIMNGIMKCWNTVIVPDAWCVPLGYSILPSFHHSALPFFP